VEVQVRTDIQEIWARLSEKLMDRHGLDVKYGGGPPEVRSRLDVLSATAWEVENGLFRTGDYVGGGETRAGSLSRRSL